MTINQQRMLKLQISIEHTKMSSINTETTIITQTFHPDNLFLGGDCKPVAILPSGPGKKWRDLSVMKMKLQHTKY